ncbi:MAG: N-formylglutamate amidohydrolase [Kiloniellales bacterium]
MTDTHDRLLDPDEPAPVRVERPHGASPFFLTCDHASNRLPRRLGTLGLQAQQLRRHIAWDAGAAGVARSLSRRLDATLVLQTYSRLVIDCNRNPEVPDAMPSVSENIAIPGNRNLPPAHARARIREVWAPYHDRISRRLDARERAGRPSVLVAVHSFTPVYDGERRPWHIGILYNRDPRLARVLLDLLRGEDHLVVGDNQPYRVSDRTDYTIPVHGEGRGIVHVEVEVRQDLIADRSGQADWAGRLAELLTRAHRRMG